MHRLHADLVLIFAAAVWGLAFLFQKSAMSHIGPLTFIAARGAIAALALAPANDSVRADVDGLAIFTGVREGSHLLEVKALGFEGQRQEVIVGAADTARVTVLLAPSALVLAPLEVAAVMRTRTVVP